MPRIAYSSVYTDQRIRLETENLTSQIDGVTIHLQLVDHFLTVGYMYIIMG